MIVYFFIVFGSLVFLTGSALLALRWAARTGQLRHFQKTALSIFDEEEPVGRMTDLFPGKRLRAMQTNDEPALPCPSATLADPMGEGRGEGLPSEFTLQTQAREPRKATHEPVVRSSGFSRSSAPGPPEGGTASAETPAPSRKR